MPPLPKLLRAYDATPATHSSLLVLPGSAMTSIVFPAGG
jgi:hypothetical protein